MLSAKWKNVVGAEKKEVIMASLLLLMLDSYFSGVSAQNMRALSDNETCTVCDDGTKCCPPKDVCEPVIINDATYMDCVEDPPSKTEQYFLYAVTGLILGLVACCMLAACIKETIKLFDRCDNWLHACRARTSDEEQTRPFLGNNP